MIYNKEITCIVSYLRQNAKIKKAVPLLLFSLKMSIFSHIDSWKKWFFLYFCSLFVYRFFAKINDGKKVVKNSSDGMREK